MAGFSTRTARQYFVPGLVVAAISLILTWVATTVNVVNITFSTINIDVRERVVGGLGTEIGETLLSFIGGATAPNFVLLGLTAVIITIVGAYLVELIPALPLGKSIFLVWTNIIFLGVIAVMIVSTQNIAFLFSLTTMAALAIYSALVAFIISLVFANTPLKLPPLPN